MLWRLWNDVREGGILRLPPDVRCDPSAGDNAHMAYMTNSRGSLSQHDARHSVDPAKSMDKLFDKVILGVLVVVLFIGLLVYVL